MSITCLNIIQKLSNDVDKNNTKLVDHMTDQKMKYEYACIKPNVTYEYFYKCLKKDWEKIINEYVNQPTICTIFTQLQTLYRYADPQKIAQFQKILEAISRPTESETHGESEFNIGEVNI